MTARKRSPSTPVDALLDEAMARSPKHIPAAVADALSREVAKHARDVDERIKKTRDEIDAGARPRKRRFRI